MIQNITYSLRQFVSKFGHLKAARFKTNFEIFLIRKGNR